MQNDATMNWGNGCTARVDARVGASEGAQQLGWMPKCLEIDLLKESIGSSQAMDD